MNYFFPNLSSANREKLEKQGVPTIRHKVDDVVGIFINGDDFAKAIRVLRIKGETVKINDEIYEVKMDSSLVELKNWEGADRKKFIEVAEKFALETKLRIIIDVPHQHSQELKGQPGLLYIHLWSAKAPCHEEDTPNEIFDIKVACNDESLVPDHITGIPIVSGDNTVGELIGTDLYIFHDICHYSSANIIKMFTRFLQESKRYLSFNKGRERERFPYLCQSQLAIEIQRIKGLIDVTEERKKKIVERIMAASCTLVLSASGLENMDFEKRFSEEYDKLLSLDKITKVKVVGKEIVVTTKTLYCTDPRTKKVHTIGRFEITIDFDYYEENESDDDQDEGLVVFENLDGDVNGYSRGMHAPHIFDGGNACWGNHLDTMKDLVKKCEIPAAVLQAIRFVESVNVEDEAGAYICSWPYKGESTARYKERMEHKCRNCEAENCDYRGE